MKKIFIVGVLDNRGATEIGLSHSFMQKGFGVVPINYRNIISSKGMKFFENMLLTLIQQEQPKLVFFSKCNNVDPNIISKISELTTTWLFNPDLIISMNRSLEVVEHAKRASFSSCLSEYESKLFIDAGVKDCFFTPAFFNPQIYKPRIENNNYKSDFAFIGTNNTHQDRNNIIEILKNNINNFKCYGPGFTNYVFSDEFSTICNSSKFMLSINTKNVSNTFSNRLVRMLGCGACVCHYDTTNTIKKYFEDMKEIIIFSSVEELILKTKNLTDLDIQKIKINGRKKALKEYTDNNFVDFIINKAEL